MLNWNNAVVSRIGKLKANDRISAFCELQVFHTYNDPCLVSQPLLVPGDLTDEETVKKTVEQTLAHYGRLDVLVNSAGILAMGSIESTDMAQYDKVMNINVRWDFTRHHTGVLSVKSPYARWFWILGWIRTVSLRIWILVRNYNRNKKGLGGKKLFIVIRPFVMQQISVLFRNWLWFQILNLRKSSLFINKFILPHLAERLRWSIFLKNLLHEHNSSIRTRANGNTEHSSNPSTKRKRINSQIF